MKRQLMFKPELIRLKMKGQAVQYILDSKLIRLKMKGLTIYIGFEAD